jgi:hypothetical protein
MPTATVKKRTAPLQKHLENAAAQEVAVNELLIDIASRAATPEDACLTVTTVELRLLAAGGYVEESRNTPALCRLIARFQDAANRLDKIRQLADAPADLERAKERESQARADAEGLQVEAGDVPALVAQVRAVKAKHDEARAQVECCEARLCELENNIAALERLAPPAIKAAVEQALCYMRREQDFRKLGKLKADILSVGRMVEPGPYNLLANGFDHAANNGHLNGFCALYCPDAVSLVKTREATQGVERRANS